MSREEYVELVQDLCEELELGEAGELLDRGLLQVGDTLVGIEYLEERDGIRLLAGLRENEEGIDRNAMHELLLEAKLGNTSFYPTFSVRPEDGHPVVAYHIRALALLEEEVDLAFVLTEQLLPLLDEWKTRLRNALDSASSGAEPLPFPGTLT